MFQQTNDCTIGDLNGWDVSSVTNMYYMFGRATAFNGNISSWNVGSVTDMSAMFRRATAFNGDISSWDVSTVQNMSMLFCANSYACGSDATPQCSSFNGDLSGWNTSAVTSMKEMFQGAALVALYADGSRRSDGPWTLDLGST